LDYIARKRREDVIAKPKQTEPALRSFGVAALYLFGSHARDDAALESDVDVFVDPASDEDFGFLPFMDAYEAPQTAFDHQVEIGYSTRIGLSPYIREDVEREALRIF
jgi:predicted nucleotidyltransferase